MTEPKFKCWGCEYDFTSAVAAEQDPAHKPDIEYAGEVTAVGSKPHVGERQVPEDIFWLAP
jgi:hypothetical protein